MDVENRMRPLGAANNCAMNPADSACPPRGGSNDDTPSADASANGGVGANAGVRAGLGSGSDTAGVSAEIPSSWRADFDAAARRPLAQRWRYAFIKTYKPVMDDAGFRAFDTMREYREWCDRETPVWLGYARV